MSPVVTRSASDERYSFETIMDMFQLSMRTVDSAYPSHPARGHWVRQAHSAAIEYQRVMAHMVNNCDEDVPGLVRTLLNFTSHSITMVMAHRVAGLLEHMDVAEAASRPHVAVRAVRFELSPAEHAEFEAIQAGSLDDGDKVRVAVVMTLWSDPFFLHIGGIGIKRPGEEDSRADEEG